MRLRAARIPADLAGNGWYEILPLPRRHPSLEQEVRADWVVVGAGFAGLAAALRLARSRPGERVVVLEAQRVAWGAAGRNSGFMIDLPHELNSENYAGAKDADRRLIAENRTAIAFARGAAEEFGLEGFLSPIGKLHGAGNRNGLAALDTFTRHIEALGEPVTVLDAADMRRITGTGYYLGGAHAPGTLLIQPAGYIRGLADGMARSHGVEIYEESPLLSLDTASSAGGAHRITTPRGAVLAPRVILAVNGHVESLGLFERRLMHVFTYASMTRALTGAQSARLGGEAQWGLIPADPMGSTVRRLRCGRVVVRNVFTWNPERETSAAQVRRIGRRRDRSFATRFPMLDGVEMQYRWGGHLCLSLNSVPAFGEIEPGLYVAACQNGLGTTRGTLAGILAADLAMGRNSATLSEWQRQAAPRRLAPEPFLSIGARAHLWWAHRRAGRNL